MFQLVSVAILGSKKIMYTIHDLCVLCTPREWLHTLAEICQSSYVIIVNSCNKLEINFVCMYFYCTENVCQV
jgi:hypothetical protein